MEVTPADVAAACSTSASPSNPAVASSSAVGGAGAVESVARVERADIGVDSADNPVILPVERDPSKRKVFTFDSMLDQCCVLFINTVWVQLLFVCSGVVL